MSSGVPSFSKMLGCATVNAFLAIRRSDSVVLYASPSVTRVLGLEVSAVVGCAAPSLRLPHLEVAPWC